MILSKMNSERLIAVLQSLPHTAHAHSVRVGLYMQIIASAMPTDVLGADRDGGLARELGCYHDIGKAALPAELIMKKGDYSAEERSCLQTHTTSARQVLENTVRCSGEAERDRLGLIAEVALTHHENWDGSGYPFRLAGEDIPIWGRICALADTYEHLRAERPSISHKRIMRELRELSGTRFDPDVVEALQLHEKEMRTLKSEL